MGQHPTPLQSSPSICLVAVLYLFWIITWIGLQIMAQTRDTWIMNIFHRSNFIQKLPFGAYPHNWWYPENKTSFSAHPQHTEPHHCISQCGVIASPCRMPMATSLVVVMQNAHGYFIGGYVVHSEIIWCLDMAWWAHVYCDRSHTMTIGMLLQNHKKHAVIPYHSCKLFASTVVQLWSNCEMLGSWQDKHGSPPQLTSVCEGTDASCLKSWLKAQNFQPAILIVFPQWIKMRKFQEEQCW